MKSHARSHPPMSRLSFNIPPPIDVSDLSDLKAPTKLDHYEIAGIPLWPLGTEPTPDPSSKE